MKKVTEAVVVKLWESVVSGGRQLLTVDKVPVRILYAGRPSSQPGADFQDAVVDIGGRVARGNIEMHVRSRDWRTHGHHHDAAYNGVVLHVVMSHDSQQFTALENGCAVPVLALDAQPAGRILRRARAPPLPCAGRKSQENILAAIDRAGDARFAEKAAAFAEESRRADARQSLYRGIMTALGYSRNQLPFELVAQSLPLTRLEEIEHTDDAKALASLEALLLGTAGFLPSQRPGLATECHPWVDALEREWGIHEHGRRPADLSWSLFRVRPNNHPVRRLAGMARLLWRFREDGLLAGFMAKLEAGGGGADLIAALTITTDGYWTEHCDFGAVCQGLDHFLIGPSRATEILVNILLPFAAARAQVAASPELAAKAIELYREHPAASENAIERHMRAQLGLPHSVVNTARRRQGLLHIYKRYCTQGRCGECELGA